MVACRFLSKLASPKTYDGNSRAGRAFKRMSKGVGAASVPQDRPCLGLSSVLNNLRFDVYMISLFLRPLQNDGCIHPTRRTYMRCEPEV